MATQATHGSPDTVTISPGNAGLLGRTQQQGCMPLLRPSSRLDRQCCGITGQTVEVAQVEAAINMIGRHVVAAQVDEPPQRLGNRRPGRAPQGVYKCQGDDRWIAISVVDDDCWAALCKVTGWSDLEELDAAQRWRDHDAIDALAAFTAQRNDFSLMMELKQPVCPLERL